MKQLAWLKIISKLFRWLTLEEFETHRVFTRTSASRIPRRYSFQLIQFSPKVPENYVHVAKFHLLMVVGVTLWDKNSGNVVPFIGHHKFDFFFVSVFLQVYEALEHRLVVAEAAQRLRLPLISKDGEVHEEDIEKMSVLSRSSLDSTSTAVPVSQ